MDQQYLYSKDFFSYYNFHSKDFYMKDLWVFFQALRTQIIKFHCKRTLNKAFKVLFFYPRARGRLSLNMPFTII